MDGINSPLERAVTQKELSDNVGVSRQVISQYCLGNTSPNVETLINIAEFFNVSSDYLIGLSVVASTDIDDKAISEKTGLTDAAIKTLKNWKKGIKHNFLISGDKPPKNSMSVFLNFEGFKQQAAINYMLDDENELLFYIASYLYDDHISYDPEDNTKIRLHNKSLGLDVMIDIDDFKSISLLKIQNVLLNIDKNKGK